MKSQVTITLDLRVVARWVLGLLLLWAAVSKLAQPTDFLGALYGYQLPLPKPLLQFVAVVLPWFELLCGLLLLLNEWTESALVAGCVLLAIFLIASGQAWARGLRISCGCFDLGMFGLNKGHPFVQFFESAGFAFLRNLALLSLAFFLLKRRLEEMASAVTVSSDASNLPPRGASAKSK